MCVIEAFGKLHIKRLFDLIFCAIKAHCLDAHIVKDDDYICTIVFLVIFVVTYIVRVRKTFEFGLNSENLVPKH